MANGVTFAGYPAVLDYSDRIADFVAQRWPASRWPFSQGRNDIPLAANPFGQNEVAGRFRLPYPPAPAPRINEVVIPTGASRYGRGLFLFGRVEMTAIAAALWGYGGDLSSLPEAWGTSESAAILRIEYEQTVERTMRALPPVRIDASGGNDLWLLPLVDARYQWGQRPGETEIDQAADWGDLFAALATATGATITPPTIAAVHGEPDRESFSDPGVTPGAVLDASALSIGSRIVLSSTGQPSFSTATAAATALAANLAAIKPWMGGKTPRRALPNNVSLIGRKAVDHFGHCGESVQVDRDIASGSNNPAEAVVHSPFWIEHFRQRVSSAVDIVADAPSLAAFEDLAEQIAADIAAWGGVQYAFSLPGVHNWTLTGCDDYLAIRVGGTDNLDAVSTHVQSLPPDFAPLVHLGQRPNIYVHPNDSAVFTLTEEPEENGWADATIKKVDGFYVGDEVRSILVKCDEISSDLDLETGNKLFSHYQCERGWFADPPSSIGQLPAWEIEATLDDVLYATAPSGTATFTKIRSVFPHTGDPPGVNPDTGEVPFHNTWRLDALCTSKLILQRLPGGEGTAPKCEVTFTTGAPGSWSYAGDTCPDGWECPPLPTDEPEETTVRQLDCIRTATERWELRKVEKYKARWIKFRYTPGGSGDYDILSYWEGDDPKSCGEYVNMQFPVGEPCEECDVIAFYDPMTDSYQAIVSPSAMVGEPEDMPIVQAMSFDGCGINYIMQTAKVFPCGSDPGLVSSQPDMVATEVLSGVQLVAPIPECESVCRYEWNGTQWNQTASCGSGSGCTCASITLDPPGPGDPTVQEFPCDRDDGQTPSPGSLTFTSVTILVCGAGAGGGYSIPLTECPAPDTDPGSGGP